MQLKLEQVVALAPDTGTLQRARKLAIPSSFSAAGADARALWADVKGSGSPYQCFVDLQGPAYRCSCPVRKQPCKHVLALLLFAAEQALPAGEPPEELSAWLTRRDGAATRKTNPTTTVRDTTAQQKRAEQREEKIQRGLDELERFLEDAVRIGLAELSKRQNDSWDAIQRRLIDAQAPGLAARIDWMRRQMCAGPHWQEPVFQALLELHLLLSAYRNRDNLPIEWAADIREYLGWRRDTAEVAATPGISGIWWVLAQGIRYESGLYTQSIWLRETTTGQFALARQFAAEQNRDGLLGGLANGSLIDAQVHYYSAHTPLRALLIHDRSQAQPAADSEALQRLQASAYPDLDSALRAARAVQCRNPFAHEIPLWIDELRLVMAGDRFALADRDGRLLPLAKDYTQLWQLLAYTGDRPATLLVIFDGRTARPWALARQGRYRALDMNEGGHG